MNKPELRQIIIEQLESRLRIAQSATQRAIDAATDEETVPEHKYDTLALEASYLAHGQAVRVQECEDDIQCYRNLVLRDSEKVTVSSYVVVIDNNTLCALHVELYACAQVPSTMPDWSCHPNLSPQ